MDEILTRILKLLDNANVRFSDRSFEEERIIVIKMIKDHINGLAKVEVEPLEAQPKKRVHLPVVKTDV